MLKKLTFTEKVYNFAKSIFGKRYMTIDGLKSLEGKFVKLYEKGTTEIAYVTEATCSDDGNKCYLDKRYGMILNKRKDTYDAEFSPCKLKSFEEYSLDEDKDGYLGAIKEHIDNIKRTHQSISFEIPNELKEKLGYTGMEYRSAEEILRGLKNG